MVHTTGFKPPIGYVPQPNDIVFTQADMSWVHNPYEDTLVITAEVASSFVHRLPMDNGSAINILYWGAYHKTGLRQTDLTPRTSPLYGFTGDSVIPEGIIKLAITLGEPPQAVTVMINFLAMKYPSTLNGVLGRPLLNALKVVTSIHCLKIKFPTAAGIGQIQGRQCDSRECYNKSLELAEMGPELPQDMEVEKITRGSMETNIDLCLQEDESIVRLVEELIEIQVDPNEPSRVVKIGKGL